MVLRGNQNAELVISIFINSSDPRISSIFNIINHLNKKYDTTAIKAISLQGEFSRGVAIDKAVHSNFIKDSDVIFLIDVDVLFKLPTLERIRRHTLRNRQIYLPIVFSEFNPELTYQGVKSTVYPTMLNGDSFLQDYWKMISFYQFHVNASSRVNNDSGYFREFGFGILSIYKEDILNSKINGFVTDIKGWGLEDVKFLEKIITAGHQVHSQLLSIAEGTKVNQEKLSNFNLEIFRAPDESLIHLFHHVLCDRKLEKNQYKMCLGTKSNTLGNYRLLKEKYFFEQDFSHFVNQLKRFN